MVLRFQLGAVLLYVALPALSRAGVVRVPQDYLLIQQACDAAQSGDTILLGALNDTAFVEQAVVAGKTLVIRSISGPLKTQIRRTLVIQNSGPEDTTKVIGIRWKTGSGSPALLVQEGRFVVENCVFDSSKYCEYWTASYAIQVGDNVDAWIRRCTFVAQQRAVKSQYGSPKSTVHVSSCIFTNSCEFALHPDYGYLSAEYCCFWQNAVDADSSVDWGAGNMPFDPLLRMPDLSLQPGSPCIDAGDPDLPLDPDGSRADIGACVPYRVAGTLYVSTGGNDDSATGSIAQPFRTVGMAYLCAVPEDSITLLPGIYVEHVRFDRTQVMLMSSGGAGVTTLAAEVEGRPVVDFRAGVPNRSTISGLTIADALFASGIHVSDRASPRIEFCDLLNNFTSVGGGLYIDSDSVTVYGCRIRLNSALFPGGGIYAVQAVGVVVDSCEIYGNSSGHAGSAIVLNECSKATITRNLVHNNSNGDDVGGPVHLTGSREVVVRNNTVCDNMSQNLDALGAGIVVDRCTTIDLRNNLVAYNQGQFGIAVISGPVGIYNEYNNVYGQWSAGIYGLTPGPGHMEVEPKYNQDYELLAGSPCIDAGDPALPVPPGGGGRIDIGAFEYQQPVAVSDPSPGQLPGEFGLGRNYPNPFNASTQIPYRLPHGAHATLAIHDLLGRTVVTLVDANQPAGLHVATWDGLDAAGLSVGSGVYFYCLRAGGEVDTRKLLMLK